MGILDTVAVSMSLICAIHCLITPLIIVILPLVATTFWADSNFHLWMMLLVIPTSALAIFQGCKKHKDRLIILLSIAGITLLLGSAVYETISHLESQVPKAIHCNSCVTDSEGSSFSFVTALTLLGGILLASAHIRNFLLCRKVNCQSCKE